MKVCCQNCHFAFFMGRVQRYVCRRYPPTHRIESHGRVSYHFPYVSEDDWCGEYRQKVRKEAADAAQGQAQGDATLVD